MSFMRDEVLSLPHSATNVLVESRDQIADAALALRAADPVLVGTVARGSSDHAATFLKYAIELTSGVPVASISPSVSSIYKRGLRLDGAAVIAISQSGRSPDIVDTFSSIGNALGIALTNNPEAPLKAASRHPIDLATGVEKSVAATKTFVASIVGGLGLLAGWSRNPELTAALGTVSGALANALKFDWSELIGALDGHRSMYILGRGPTLAIAAEAALKLKETCGIHAEAYSTAEVLHGPARIVENGFPVLVLSGFDATQVTVSDTADRLVEQGARVFTTNPLAEGAHLLPFADAGNDFVTALSLIAPFYLFAEALSRHRGFDPDRPPHLRKVTETL